MMTPRDVSHSIAKLLTLVHAAAALLVLHPLAPEAQQRGDGTKTTTGPKMKDSPPQQGGSTPTSGQSVGNARSKELNEQGVKAVSAKRYDEAETLFKQAIGLDSGNLSAVFNLASVYLQNKKEQAAIDLLKRYVELAPNDIGIAIRLGDAYFASRDPRRARDVYEAAYSKAPKYPELPSKLASCSLALKDFKAAESYLKKSSELEPKNAEVLTNLSSVLLANGKPRDAIAVAKRAVQITATSELYLILGNSYELFKDGQNAIIAYERARDLGDKSKELETKIAALRGGDEE